MSSPHRCYQSFRGSRQRATIERRCPDAGGETGRQCRGQHAEQPVCLCVRVCVLVSVGVTVWEFEG